MLGCQVHIAKLSTLPNHQLHIVNATLSTRQVEFFFQAAQMFFRPPQNSFKIVCPMPKIHSLATQTRFLWILFSIQLPNVPTYQPSGLPVYLPTYLGIQLPTHVLSI